jgi:hypothetical protein
MFGGFVDGKREKIGDPNPKRPEKTLGRPQIFRLAPDLAQAGAI